MATKKQSSTQSNPYLFYSNFLNNHPHYPYITNGWRRYEYGDTPTYTLTSPLFQSINPILFSSILESYYTKEYIKREINRAENGEMWEKYNIGDAEDLLNYLIIKMQTNCKKLIFINKENGEKFEIPLTKENLNKKIEELLPNSFSINTLEVYAQ